MGTKVRNLLGLGLAVISLLSLNGCGGSSGANVITVTVSSTSNTLILGQSATLTATVSGATNTAVNWTPQFISGKPPCQYTFTQTTGKTSSLTNCPTDGSFGTLTNLQSTGTATYTAPNTLPSTTTFPNLVIVITAQSVQNTGRTGTVNLTLISGISVVLTPQTASVPTQEQQQFSVLLTNDIGNKGVAWSITQNVPFTNSSGTAVNYPQLPTCSPTCGTITVPDPSNTSVALYTAPPSIPTAITPAQTNNSTCPQNVTIVAASVSDNTELTLGTITIVTGGPITFNGISPSIAPQGAAIWDIYLNAPNISSTATIFLNGVVPKNSADGQTKILFPLPVSNTTTTTTTCTNTTNPTSTGALLRLNEKDLGNSGPVTVTIADPAQKCNGLAAGTPCSATGTGTFTIMPVRATSTASVPDDIVQGKSLEIPVTIDGGYFGPGGNLANPLFDGIGLAKNATTSTSRKLNTQLQSNLLNSASPGLYTLSVSTNAMPAPFTNNPSITNMALFPDYSKTPPAVVSTIAPGYLGIPVGTNPTSANPSAMDIDPDLGVVVVAEVGAPAKSGPPPVPAVPSAIQFFAIGNKTLTPIDTTGTPCAVACPVTSQTYANVSINVPTGISVNRVLHTVAIVNYGDQSVTVLPIPVPGSGQQSSPSPFTLDISGALQGSISPAPIPYSIGVDPDSNLAIVAYSSTSSASAANLGFIVNLNPNTVANPWGCTLDHAINPSSTKVGQCLTAQVTLNNGAYPQVAVAPHGHLALVTPGGSGVVRGVDVTQPSTSNVILSSSLTAGLVTVTIDTTKCPPPLSDPVSGQTSPCPFSMIPGNSGSVLITGVKPGNSANDALFNGVFPVNVLSSNSFNYAVTNLTATDTGTQNCQTANNVRTCASVFYGNPNQTYGISSTTQGIAINPVTHTAAIADANSTAGTQIWVLNSLDQSVTSFGFSADCTAFIPSCAVTPEFLATTDVAWQPYTNEVVSYNPNINQVSISDPVSGQRYAFACNTNGAAISSGTCITNPTAAQEQTFRQQIVLNGTGAVTLSVANGTLSVQNGTTNTLNLFGGLAVDPGSNQAFVLKSGSGTIDVIDLGGPSTPTPIKPIHVSEVIVPSPTPGPGVIGGIPHALVPQATLTCTTPVPPATSCDLPGVRVFGDGFDATTQVLLDGASIPAANVTAISSRLLNITIPGALLSFPHHYALQAVTNGGQVGSVQSNAVDFIVVQAVDLSQVCTTASGQGTLPTSVAIADQIANGPFSPIALVSVTGCNSVVAIDINPTVTVTVNQVSQTQPNPHFGKMFGSPVGVGTNPEGIAISQTLGLAVVANNGSGTASVLDLTPLPMNSPVKKVPDVATGTNPAGVAVDDAIGVAVVTNTGSNTVSSLNLASLFASGSTAAATSLTPVSIGGIQQPLAVAIDPNRGINNQGLAVITSVELSSGSASTGGLQGVEIGFVTPSLNTSFNSGIVSATPTGIVFDPTVATTTTNSGVFYANSSGTNTITQYNPDSGGGGSSVNVGINPTSLAINPLTGAILTVNSASNTISIVDTLSNPFATRQTLGFPGSGTFGAAIDQFTNLAVIVDRANMRVFLFPMPN